MNVDSIVLKALLTWAITTIGMILFIPIEWSSAVIAGGVIASILFIINRISAEHQIGRIMGKFENHFN